MSHDPHPHTNRRPATRLPPTSTARQSNHAAPAVAAYGQSQLPRPETRSMLSGHRRGDQHPDMKTTSPARQVIAKQSIKDGQKMSTVGKTGLKTVLTAIAVAMATVVTLALSSSAPAAAADVTLAATQYVVPRPTGLPHEGAIVTTLTNGPVLPAGSWIVSASVYVLNSTGRADTLRCGLVNGAGGIVAGTGTTMVGSGLASLSVPALVTLFAPERLNLYCSHDATLPAGVLQAQGGVVVAQQVAATF